MIDDYEVIAKITMTTLDLCGSNLNEIMPIINRMNTTNDYSKRELLCIICQLSLLGDPKNIDRALNEVAEYNKNQRAKEEKSHVD